MPITKTRKPGRSAVPASLKFGADKLSPEQLRGILEPARAKPFLTLALERRNEAHLTAAQQAAFKKAVQGLIDEGRYQKFVDVHANMLYRMHTLSTLEPHPASGTLRFLPWHRVFLRDFEEELRTVVPDVTIPYWEWTRRREIPPWLEGFPGGVNRDPGEPDGLPSRLDIWTRLQAKPYVLFTLMLEGLTPQVPAGPGGIAIDGAHSRVHMWVGGDMGDIMTSPKDPLFFLHHAEVDRLWHVWQLRNPGDHPVFTGADHVMDPWTETYADVADLHAHGIRYEDETFALDLVPEARPARTLMRRSTESQAS